MQCWHYSIFPFLFLIRCKGMIRKSRYFHVPSRSVKNHTQMLQVIIRIASYTIATRTLNGILVIFFLQGTSAKEILSYEEKLKKLLSKSWVFLCQMTEKGRGFLMGGTQSNQKLSNERWPIEIWHCLFLVLSMPHPKLHLTTLWSLKHYFTNDKMIVKKIV